jgi:hypothetical protein
MKTSELPQTIQLALTELKQALSDLYGQQLRSLYLYGSYARGTAHEEVRYRRAGRSRRSDQTRSGDYPHEPCRLCYLPAVRPAYYSLSYLG